MTTPYKPNQRKITIERTQKQITGKRPTPNGPNKGGQGTTKQLNYHFYQKNIAFFFIIRYDIPYKTYNPYKTYKSYKGL